MMTLWINAEQHQMSGPVNIAELITKLDLPAPAILVEHNGVALRRDEWLASPLLDGDRIELIRIVAGG